MPNTSTECIQRFATEGPLGVAALTCLGLALTAVFAWLLWRERRVTGPGWAWVFWVLRSAAIVGVLWMLLGPTWVSEYRTTTMQSIALMVDTSESMDVADPPQTTDMLRWNLVPTSGGKSSSLLVACDRASIAVRVATTQCGRMREALQRHSPRSQLKCHSEKIEQPVRRAIENLQRSLQEDSLGGEDFHARVGRILSQMQGDLCRNLRALQTSTDEGAEPLAEDTVDLLQALDNSLTGVLRRLDRLGHDLAAAMQDKQKAASRSGTPLTRRQHVAETLDWIESGALGELRDQVQLKRFRFERLMSPIATDNHWSEALNDAMPYPPSDERANGNSDESAPDSPATDISAALQQLADVSGSGLIQTAILFSDGRHNKPHSRPPEEVAATLGDLVVHVVPIGNTEPVRDVFLHRVGAPTAVAIGDSIVIDVIVTATQCDGEMSTIALRQDGALIEERTLVFDSDRLDRRLSFYVPAERAGRREFVLSIEPLEDEAGTTNNVETVAVEVMRDKIRVLLADRISRWEFRYLEQLLRRDEHVEFDKLLFYPTKSASGALRRSYSLPHDVDAWSRYDVVILGDLGTRQLDIKTQEALAQSIRRRGGNLIVIAGRENMPGRYVGQPLMDLLPVERALASPRGRGVTLSLTEAGRAHPALLIAPTPDESRKIWERQYQWRPIYSLSEYCRPKPAAETWLSADAREPYVALPGTSGEGPQHAFLSWHQVGAGKVVYLAAPLTYQLRFRQGDRYHHRFWGQLMRWVTSRNLSVGTQNVRIATDRVRYKVGEEVDVMVRLRDARGIPVQGATLTAVARTRSNNSKEGQVKWQTAATIDLIADENVPGRYLGKILGLPRGAYHIEPTGDAVDKLLKDATQEAMPSTLVTVEASGGLEMLDTRCNLPLLERLAEITGGQVIPPTAIGEILRLSSFAPEVSRRVESRPLWNRWSVLWFVFACVCVEWLIRKRMGLI